MSGRAEHRRVPRRLPAIGMACRVVWRVRLDLDDDAADTVHQERPSQELTRDGVDISREEGAGDAGGQKSCSVSVGLAVAASTFRALRPRSARSTRPSSAAEASRSARSSAPSRSAESPPRDPCRGGSCAPCGTRRPALRHPRSRRASGARRPGRRRRSARARRSCRRGRTCRSRGRPSASPSSPRVCRGEEPNENAVEPRQVTYRGRGKLGHGVRQRAEDG